MDTLLITGTLLSSLLDHNASWPYQTASELPAQMTTFMSTNTFKLLKDSPTLEFLHLKPNSTDRQATHRNP
jgi:hypothetical protein